MSGIEMVVHGLLGVFEVEGFQSDNVDPSDTI
jgi:hypothetical protein